MSVTAAASVFATAVGRSTWVDIVPATQFAAAAAGDELWQQMQQTHVQQQTRVQRQTHVQQTRACSSTHVQQHTREVGQSGGTHVQVGQLCERLARARA